MRLFVFLTAVFFAGHAGAVVIDFDDAVGWPRTDPGYNVVMPYIEDGFQLTDNARSEYHYSDIFEAGTGIMPHDSPYLGLHGYNIESIGPYKMTVQGGGPFDLNGVEISHAVSDWDPGEITGLQLQVTGFFQNGGSISAMFDSFVTDVWYSLPLEGFTDLSSFAIAPGGEPGDLLRIDNIAINSTKVPLPSSLILLALALFAMGGSGLLPARRGAD